MIQLLFGSDRNFDQVPDEVLPAGEGCPVCGSVFVEALEKHSLVYETTWVVGCYIGHRIELRQGCWPKSEPDSGFSAHDRLRGALEAVASVNVAYLKTRPDAMRPLYESGVRLARHDLLAESFSAIPAVQHRGFGDADDLAAWRVAELRQAGEQAEFRVVYKPSPYGGHVLTVQVRRADGTIEDPSEILKSLERS